MTQRVTQSAEWKAAAVDDLSRGEWHDILVVEDDASIRALLVELLTDAGYAVRAAVNGTEAFVALDAHRPALVLLDVLMPTLTGEEVSAAICQHDPTLPIVLISASPSRARAMVEAGLAEHFLVKPFNVDDLLACVRRFVPLPT